MAQVLDDVILEVQRIVASDDRSVTKDATRHHVSTLLALLNRSFRQKPITAVAIYKHLCDCGFNMQIKCDAARHFETNFGRTLRQVARQPSPRLDEICSRLFNQPQPHG